MTIKACIFDAYGTLFDVAAAARIAANEPGFEALRDTWPQIAKDWRDRQLQYTWLLAATGGHADFWRVTQDGLDWALEAAGLDGDATLRERLLALYWELPAYEEVPAMLAALREAGIRAAILSNGTGGMLDAAMRSAGVSDLFEAVISVEDVGVFKPDYRVYSLVEKRLSVPAEAALFVSANGWDAACATGFGLPSVWVNRAGQPEDRLPWRPAHRLSDLTGLPDLARRG
ncbi:haloacid dehalogenase type II [Rhodobacteraceae bacterium WD3A24]|nr:haloacid dehalogenase type II [Rhodobacteraceae bacterium WD3A24]